MEKQFKKYFLGANSCEGFVSHFGDCYSPDDGWRAFIIKGGPGTGKSSFMKFIASKALQNGYDTELCVCSSDPHSLDGVIIKELKTVFLDGTAPHVVEPKFPGVCEQIIYLGEFWDEKLLYNHREAVLDVTRLNSAVHKRVSGYLRACGQLIYDNLKTARLCTDTERTENFARMLCKRLIPNKGGKGLEWIRFIQGVTPLGLVSYTKTLTDFCDKKIIIEDKFGSVSGIITDTVRRDALSKGYEVISIKNPFLPSELYDHIIIPELSLCIATENEFLHFDSPERRIHSRRFTDISMLKEHRTRMGFNRRVTRDILLTACETLQRAKAIHDDIEKYYMDAMNFESISQLANETAKKLGLK